MRENFRQIAPSLSVCVLIMPDAEFEFLTKTGAKELRACKDLNDLHIQGIKINSLQTKYIDQYCLEEILNSCKDVQTQYIAVGEFIKSVTNPMIRSDIARFLSEKWRQDIADIKNWFQVVDKAEDDANIFKTASQSLKQLEEEVAEGFLDLGFPTLDSSLEGVRKKDVILIGAYPSIGKTFLAGQLLLHFVIRHKLRVLFFSLEMSAGALMERLAASLMGISTKELVKQVECGKLGATYQKIQDTLDKYIRIIDLTSLKIDDIDRIIKQANLIQFSQPVDVVIIDYLQIMGGMDSFDEKEATAKNLKPLAKNNNVLLLVLSQLARGINSWERPTMNKLKGGGANEAVGDIILMLYKKAENPKLTLEEQNNLKNTITISIEKGRRGYSVKEVDLNIDKSKTLISEK
jgi:replicative DNA helicase